MKRISSGNYYRQNMPHSEMVMEVFLCLMQKSNLLLIYLRFGIREMSVGQSLIQIFVGNMATDPGHTMYQSSFEGNIPFSALK